MRVSPREGVAGSRWNLTLFHFYLPILLSLSFIPNQEWTVQASPPKSAIPGMTFLVNILHLDPIILSLPLRVTCSLSCSPRDLLYAPWHFGMQSNEQVHAVNETYITYMGDNGFTFFPKRFCFPKGSNNYTQRNGSPRLGTPGIVAGYIRRHLWLGQGKGTSHHTSPCTM